MITLSIVILEYNQPEATIELLKSIENSEFENFELIIIDNASKSNSKEFVNRNYPKVKYIQTNTNLGYAGGNNIGINEAKGEYILLINNDTLIFPNTLGNLVRILDEDPQCGIVCPKIKFYEKPEIIQFAGFTKINQITGRNTAIGNKERDDGRFDSIIESPYAHGAAMMIRRSVIDKGGLLPECFFLYYEELDFSEKVKKLGYHITLQPNSIVLHKVSLSIGKSSPIKTFYLNRNRIFFMRRNQPLQYLLLFFAFYVLVAFPKAIFLHLIKFEFNHISQLCKALIWNMTHKRYCINE